LSLLREIIDTHITNDTFNIIIIITRQRLQAHTKSHIVIYIITRGYVLRGALLSLNVIYVILYVYFIQPPKLVVLQIEFQKII